MIFSKSVRLGLGIFIFMGSSIRVSARTRRRLGVGDDEKSSSTASQRGGANSPSQSASTSDGTTFSEAGADFERQDHVDRDGLQDLREQLHRRAVAHDTLTHHAVQEIESSPFMNRDHTLRWNSRPNWRFIDSFRRGSGADASPSIIRKLFHPMTGHDLPDEFSYLEWHIGGIYMVYDNTPVRAPASEGSWFLILNSKTDKRYGGTHCFKLTNGNEILGEYGELFNRSLNPRNQRRFECTKDLFDALSLFGKWEQPVELTARLLYLEENGRRGASATGTSPPRAALIPRDTSPTFSHSEPVEMDDGLIGDANLPEVPPSPTTTPREGLMGSVPQERQRSGS